MQKPCLIVLDVGHGSAAVLHDEGGTVVFDAGPGAHVSRYLKENSVDNVQSMLLSHADSDHIGGAITLLLNSQLSIEEVLLNSDSSKDSKVFMQLCVALADANRRAGTKIDRRLARSTRIERTGAKIEVLHPPDEWALSGAGAQSANGKRHTSNSLSAAIRVSRGPKSSVLFGGDIEFSCLDEWKQSSIQPSACVLIFPHHGGLPGTSDDVEAERFASELIQAVSPDVVVFSIHRARFGNPRDAVLHGIMKANQKIAFACTQLPDRICGLVAKEDQWFLHRSANQKGIKEGDIRMEFLENSVQCHFGDSAIP